MGLTYVKGTIKGTRGRQQEVQFLVDSGASYSLLPEKVWKAIGLKPERTELFTLADGTQVKRAVSEAFVMLPDGSTHTPVILGEPSDDEALLGAITLEELGLVLNPFSRTLHKMRLLI
jgi:clan AA aspartic protease